jgi:predicted phage terminase large subunit-like protein
MNEKVKELYQVLHDDMAVFAKTCFPTAITAEIPSFHREIYKNLSDDSIKRLLAASFRGSAKSTLVSLIYPMWRLAFKKEDEDLFIIIVSEAQGQSINFLNRIKYHLERSRTFRLLFGDFSQTTAKRWTQNDIILANGTRIVALGTGQRIRGAIEGDTRPNVIILDDIESELNAATPEARAGNRMWITDAVIPSLADGGRIIMIGTVIHEDCFLCWAKGSSSWKVLWYGITDEHDVPIWEARFPMDRIMNIKEEFSSVGNLNGFYQEYMNIAQAPDSAPFKPSFIRMHDYTFGFRGDKHVLWRKIGDQETVIPVNLYMGIDPASTLSKTSDYFVIAVIGLDASDNAYIIDLFRDKVSPAVQPELILDHYMKYKPRRTKIETVGYQEALRVGVRTLMQERGIYIPGIEAGVKPRTAKSERLISMVPRFARGRFFFRYQDLTAQQEFLSYPSGRNDDIMDAVFFALDGAQPCKDKDYIEESKRKKWAPPNWMQQ